VRPSRSPLSQIIGATILLLVAGVIFIPAFLYWNGSIQRSVAALPRCGDVPQFEFSDQTGQPIGAKELSGTVWVAGFLDATKPDDTELLGSKFAELDQDLRGAKALTLVLFFIGTEQKSVQEYARRHEASDRWRLVSVPERDSSALLQTWSSATAECRHDLRPDNLFVLVDQKGVIRGVYTAAEPEVVQKILTDAGTLLRAMASKSAP